MNHGHRIGPVCSLAFHPRDRFLAAGGTDNVVHIFGPTT
jgi:WD40 repeat protein